VERKEESQFQTTEQQMGLDETLRSTTETVENKIGREEGYIRQKLQNGGGRIEMIEMRREETIILIL
jgi:hypothetical protein